MDFIKRLSGVLQNNSVVKKTNKTFFKGGFNSNALKNKQLKNDVFEIQTTSGNVEFQPIQNPIDNNLFDDYLALNYPAKFIAKYLNPTTIENAIKTNPRIEEILKEANLEVKYDLNNVTSIIMSHLIPTAKKAQEIYLNLGHNKNEQNYINLTKAALLHDIGKAFIPSEILNKKGKLTSKERQIIELHNKLSYEILKTTPLDPKVAKLALEHHDYDKNITRTTENQTLAVADVYCALKENRPYKKSLSELATKTIMYDMGTSGKFDAKYISYIN